MPEGEMDHLHIFYDAHKSELSEADYNGLLKKINDQITGGDYDDNRNWTEEENRLAFQGSWSHWVGHDDTIYEDCRIVFSKEEHIPNVTEWKKADIKCLNIPCEGYDIEYDRSNREGDSWSYRIVTDRKVLLKCPMNLDGIWSLVLYVKKER